ncbi:hypothetical protein [Streptomyces collinus]|uniref:hypothetical protein n=1 Tax=Streptomyces collinus TaxID=42684 RepID=UPI00331AE961
MLLRSRAGERGAARTVRRAHAHRSASFEKSSSSRDGRRLPVPDGAVVHTRLPKAGYIPEEGEVEEDDAESNFFGHLRGPALRRPPLPSQGLL